MLADDHIKLDENFKNSFIGEIIKVCNGIKPIKTSTLLVNELSVISSARFHPHVFVSVFPRSSEICAWPCINAHLMNSNHARIVSLTALFVSLSHSSDSALILG